MSRQIGFRVRGRIGAIFLARHAISAGDAIPFVPKPGDARAFARLRAAGIVRGTGSGLHWFDLHAYSARAEATSRKAVAWSLLISVLGAGVAVLFYRG